MLDEIVHFRPGVTLSNILYKMCHNKLIAASCWPTMLHQFAKTSFKLCTTTPNNTQQHATSVQTDATCNIQQCWELLAYNIASVCKNQFQTPAQQVTTPNNPQQHATSVQTDATCNIQHCWELFRGVVGQQCCVRLHVALECLSKVKKITKFDLRLDYRNAREASSHEIVCVQVDGFP